MREFNYGFFNLSAGENPDTVYMSALCRGDINQDRCNICLNYTVTELKQFCPSNKAATAWSEFCLVRYANRNMYGLLENDPRTCAFNPNYVSNPDQFNRTLSELLNNLRSKAATGGHLRKYAAGNATAGDVRRVYAMVQCTPDMDEQNCTTCLNFAISEFQKCCAGRLGCRVLRPTCTLRFESSSFFNQTAVPLPSLPTQAPQPLPSSPTTSISPTSTGGKRNEPTRTVIIVIASIIGSSDADNHGLMSLLAVVLL